VEIETRLAAHTFNVSPRVFERANISAATPAHGAVDLPVHFDQPVAHSIGERGEQLTFINIQFLS
jgi:hypothetical protein